MKRLLDIAIAGSALIALLPALLVVAVLVRMDSSGPSLFLQERIGRGGRPFRIVKFRTMRHASSTVGPLITAANDSRITRLGRLLRKSKLDELPQLWNVLRGEMSLVGPRPEVSKYVDLYTDRQSQVLTMRPGITDPASIAFIDEEAILSAEANPDDYYRTVLMPKKIEINLAYAESATLGSDARVILRTLLKIRDNSKARVRNAA